MNADVNRENASDEALVFALLEAAARVELRLDRLLSNTRGISFREYQLIRALSRLYDGSATRVELAGAVGLTPSAVTRALKPIEKLGYVVTQKSARDARRSLAELTPAGRELLADAQGAVDDAIADLGLEHLDVPALATALRAVGRD
ncbi:MAG: MarR family transcriptional regulator [Gammaproteobacteria bacterium]|jgi:DNA-binding MarR family transcriptional regulator|nr:MarR family transcriptional regulator [Gammaproteobacteria bacterium]|tara:strand:+ start:2042 stop:2482 length:441 start_codon:yes stop_codon:yes gene_type:complete